MYKLPGIGKPVSCSPTFGSINQINKSFEITFQTSTKIVKIEIRQDTREDNITKTYNDLCNLFSSLKYGTVEIKYFKERSYIYIKYGSSFDKQYTGDVI